MATVNFLYRSTKDKANLHLRLLYRFDNIDYVIGTNTKFEASKDYWSKQHKKKSKDIHISNKQTEVNNELNKIENHILNAFNLINPSSVNKEWLQSQIDYYYNPTQQDKAIPNNLIDYIDYYIDYRKNDKKKSSEAKINSIKHKLKRFEAYRKKQILIKDINDNFKNELVNYLKSQMYAPNTIQRDLVFIKTFCKHARFLGIETHSQLDGLRLEREKIEKIYLTFEDLEKIEKIEKSKLTESLESAKDWLIISCYTAQRISDFMRFTDKQIRIENGKHLIEFTQKKTDKEMTVPLHPKVLEILEKRNGKFPKPITDQKYNEYIKTVCQIAEINQLVKGSIKTETKPKSKIYRKKNSTFEKWKLVTSHIGRRSFASNFYGTIPTTYLISVTGHSTEKMFLTYIGKGNKDLAIELSKLFD